MKEVEVKLTDLRFFCFHGVNDYEKLHGNEYVVNLSVSYTPRAAFDDTTENIDEIISYADLFAIVSDEMKRSRRLLETLAYSISEKIKTRYGNVMSLECSITKKTPPIPGMLGEATVVWRETKD